MRMVVNNKKRIKKMYIPAMYNNPGQEGFGIVEAIAASVILAGVIVTTLTLAGMIEELKYQSSIRDAVRQVVDADIEDMKQKLFDFRYRPSAQGSSSGAITKPCYTTNSNCRNSSNLVITSADQIQICRLISRDFIRFLQGRPEGFPLNGLQTSDTILNLNNSTHTVLNQSPVVIRKFMESLPSVISFGMSTDEVHLRVTYSVSSTSSRIAKAGLLGDSRGEILRIVSLYPDSHAYCNPE